jgi:hypothetical protein
VVTLKKHTHRAKVRGEDWGWTRCVEAYTSVYAVDHSNPGRARADGVHCHGAHGCVTFTEYCHCGAIRYVEVNGGFRAETPWMLPKEALP